MPRPTQRFQRETQLAFDFESITANFSDDTQWNLRAESSLLEQGEVLGGYARKNSGGTFAEKPCLRPQRLLSLAPESEKRPRCLIDTAGMQNAPHQSPGI